MTLDGLRELEARLTRIVGDAASAGDGALSDSAAHLLGEAMQLTPYEEGDLEGSGDIRPIDGGYEVGFYGQGIKAIVQHERIDFNHPIKGQAKFLEAPFAANQDRYLERVAAEIRKALS